MKIAIFSDIHANLEALEAVLADTKNQGCTDYVCLGDVVGYNADPVACLNIIRDMGCPIVKGNHDFDSGNDTPLDQMNDLAADSLKWTRQQLSVDQRKWLSRLRMVRQVQDFTIVHSTLDQPTSWNYVTNRHDAMSNFSYQISPVCFYGHTHLPITYYKHEQTGSLPPTTVPINDGVKYFINPGAVGQPRDGDWRASYCIYDLETKVVTFRRVAYDLVKAQNKIIMAGLHPFLAQRLANGE